MEKEPEIIDAIVPAPTQEIKTDKPNRMFRDLKETDKPLSPLPFAVAFADEIAAVS